MRTFGNHKETFRHGKLDMSGRCLEKIDVFELTNPSEIFVPTFYQFDNKNITSPYVSPLFISLYHCV